MTENIVFIVITLISLCFAIYFYRDAINKGKRIDADIKRTKKMLAQHHIV